MPERDGANVGKVAACTTIIGHFMHLLVWGKCGCWDEGRNRHPYYGWTEADRG